MGSSIRSGGEVEERPEPERRKSGGREKENACWSALSVSENDEIIVLKLVKQFGAKSCFLFLELCCCVLESVVTVVTVH